MRRSLLVLALALGGVLLLAAPASAPPLYGLQIRPIRGEYDPKPIGMHIGRSVVRSADVGGATAYPTDRQQPYYDVIAGTTLEAEGSYDFDDTDIDRPQNPTVAGVEERCTAGNSIVLTSQRVETPPPEGVAEDALAEPWVATINPGNPPTFEVVLSIVDNARGEYYLRVRCVTPEDLKREGIEGAPQEEELEQLGEFLNSSEGERARSFRLFRNFGTNLYVWPKEG
jgi:hypothetical protein